MNDSDRFAAMRRWGALVMIFVLAGAALLLSQRFTCEAPTHVPAYSPEEDRAMRDDLAERRATGEAPPAPTTGPTTKP